MRDRPIAIVAILCATVGFIGSLTALVILVKAGYGGQAVLGLVGAVLAAYLQSLHNKVAAMTPPATPPAGEDSSTPPG
jgi:hypothetical protein